MSEAMFFLKAKVDDDNDSLGVRCIVDVVRMSKLMMETRRRMRGSENLQQIRMLDSRCARRGEKGRKKFEKK